MLHLLDAGTLAYRPAWDLQLQLHDKILAGEPGYAAGALMLVEHPAVITIGRRPDAQKHLLASFDLLAARGVEVVETDRGGDITFHGPGQLVAYPIIPLNTYNFNLHSYMRFLEEVVIQTLAQFDIRAQRDPSPKPATGVWVNINAHSPMQPPPSDTALLNSSTPAPHSVLSRGGAQSSDLSLAKICAMGIKLRRWVTLHGIALNVSTDLSFFNLINPCGLSRPVTSMQNLLRDRCPPMPAVKDILTHTFQKLLPPRGNGR